MLDSCSSHTWNKSDVDSSWRKTIVSLFLPHNIWFVLWEWCTCTSLLTVRAYGPKKVQIHQTCTPSVCAAWMISHHHHLPHNWSFLGKLLRVQFTPPLLFLPLELWILNLELFCCCLCVTSPQHCGAPLLSFNLIMRACLCACIGVRLCVRKSIVIYNSLHPSPTTLYTHTFCLFNIAWGHTHTHTHTHTHRCKGAGGICVLWCVSPLRMVKGALLRPSNLHSESPFHPPLSFSNLFTLLHYPVFILRSLSSLSPFYLSPALFLNFTLGVSAFTLFSMWINTNSSPHSNSFGVSHTRTYAHTSLSCLEIIRVWGHPGSHLAPWPPRSILTGCRHGRLSCAFTLTLPPVYVCPRWII